MKVISKVAVFMFFVSTVVSCSKESSENINIFEAENNISIESELFAKVNEHRVSIGKSELLFSSIAYIEANNHTDYMISIGATNHDNFGSRASKISSEISVELIAENVAKDFDNACEAFQGWFDSTSHMQTMEGDFSHTAVSVKLSDAGKLYFTQIFFRVPEGQ